MTTVTYLKTFRTMAWIIAVAVMLFRCVPLIRELRAYSGSSRRTSRHNLLRVYQIMVKPWGLVAVGLFLYWGLEQLLLFSIHDLPVVYVEKFYQMDFGFAAALFAFPVYATIERLVMKRILKSEYLDYCFWEFELSNHPKPPPKRGQVAVESFKTMRVAHYGYIFLGILLSIGFAASVASGTNSLNIVTKDGISAFRADNPAHYIIPVAEYHIAFEDIQAIRASEKFDSYKVIDIYGRYLYVDPEIVEYVSEQSGISYEPFPNTR